LGHDSGAVDLIVLNPPRKGCDEQVLRDAAALAPAKIIYVSCSPRTLARDLDILSRLGWITREVQPVDMFPQTPHVENVALLEQVRQTPHRPDRKDTIHHQRRKGEQQ
jgi:23S rRNA (uracil1939-C5)-methyltransferase